MNAQRSFEIKAAIAAFTVSAAIVSGLLTTRSAQAAPPTPKKSTAKVTRAKKGKPIVVKMSGNRRAAETRAVQLYTAAIARQDAEREAELAVAATQPTQDRGASETQAGTVARVGNMQTPAGTNFTPGITNPSGYAAYGSPLVATSNGYANSGYSFGYGNGGYAVFGPPVVNTGNGFAPLYSNGFGGNSTVVPYGNGIPLGGYGNPNGYNPFTGNGFGF